MIKNKEAILEKIDKITDVFYQNRAEEGTKELPQLISELTEISAEISREKQGRFTNILKNLMESMTQQDYVLMADILVFEMKDLLQED